MRLNVHRGRALVVPLALVALLGALSTPALAKAPTQLLRFSAKGNLKISDPSGEAIFPDGILDQPAHECPLPGTTDGDSQLGRDSYSGSAHVSYSGSAIGSGVPTFFWKGTGSIKLTMTSDETVVCRYYLPAGNGGPGTLLNTKTMTAHTTIHLSAARGVKFNYLTYAGGPHLVIGYLPHPHFTYSMTKVDDGVTSHLKPTLSNGSVTSELGLRPPRGSDTVTYPVSPWCFEPENYGVHRQLHATLIIGGRRWPH
jgi:hypothetical protein